MKSLGRATASVLKDVALAGVMLDSLMRHSEKSALTRKDPAVTAVGEGRFMAQNTKRDHTGKGSVFYLSLDTKSALSYFRVVDSGQREASWGYVNV